MLPVHDIRPELEAALDKQNRLVVEAPTGSGKSTQIPQWLIERLPGKVLVLQPRRLAARMLAARVASERGGRPGGEVGYRIRFDNKTGPDTRLVYVTEGMLMRQLLGDPTLEGVSAVVFDEFHERSLNTDLALARLRELQRDGRPDLKLVVMSATLDATTLIEYLAPCKRLVSDGRTFPVDIEYRPPRRAPTPPRPGEEFPVWDLALDAFEEIANHTESGHILVFMPGGYEIRRTIEVIERSSYARDFDVMPLHGRLTPADQDRAVAPSDRRKVVVSTNVAETSLTIDGVRAVIDSGLVRLAKFDPHRKIDTLTIQKISKASANQRAGRAGRTSNGVCFRLYGEREFGRRDPQELPEVQRVDLAEAMLALAGGGFDPETFPWFERPDDVRMETAKDLLLYLGAMRTGAPGSTHITDLGRRMLAFPLHPRYARLLLAADELKCVPEAALAAAIAQGRPFWLEQQDRRVEEARRQWIDKSPKCDFTHLFRAWQYARDARYDRDACEQRGLHANAAREVDKLFRQLLDIAKRQGLTTDSKPSSELKLRRALFRAFSDQLAIRRDKGTGRCHLVGKRKGKLGRNCRVKEAELLVATEISEIEGRDLNVLLGRTAAVEMAWLWQDFPELMRDEEEVRYNARTKRVLAERKTLFGDLVVETVDGGEPSEEAAAGFLANEILEGNLKLKHWNDTVQQWIARVNTLAEFAPELGYTAITEEDLRLILEQLCLGAKTHKEVRDRSPWNELRGWLAPGLPKRLDHFAPEKIDLVSGRHGRVRYNTGETPIVSARIQELYDTTGKITIADGRITCRVEILAPNMRPQQLTEDLDSFWENGYPMLKKELRGRYPKHEWR